MDSESLGGVPPHEGARPAPAERPDVSTEVIEAWASDAEEVNALSDVLDRDQDRELRRTYALWCIWIMIVQLAILNLFMFLVGACYLHFTDWLFHAYMLATFGEIVGIVYLIVAYLFPGRKSWAGPP